MIDDGLKKKFLNNREHFLNFTKSKHFARCIKYHNIYCSQKIFSNHVNLHFAFSYLMLKKCLKNKNNDNHKKVNYFKNVFFKARINNHTELLLFKYFSLIKLFEIKKMSYNKT